MSGSEPRVRSGVMVKFPDVLGGGERLAKVLEDAGLDLSDIADRDAMIPLVKVAGAFEAAARHLNDPHFGLHYAEAFPPGASGLVGHLQMAAPTVGDFLAISRQYIELGIDVLSPELVDTGEGVRFSARVPPGINCSIVQLSEFLLAIMVLRVRAGAGPQWTPQHVSFEHRAPLDDSEHRRVLGPSLSFDAPEYSIWVDKAAVGRQMPIAMPNLIDTVRVAGDQALAQLRRQRDFVDRTRALITERLSADDAPFDLESVSAALAVSSRTLQWRLAREHTSYESQLNQARIDVAARLLRDTDLSMSEISGRLRFSEPSAFSRWAVRQFEMTPSEYRKQLRHGA